MSTPANRVVVLASGEGTLFEAIATAQREFLYQVELLVVSRSNCGAAEKAKKLGIPVMLHLDFFSKGSFDGFDLVFLAGFLKQVPSDFLRKFQGPVLNSHPSLLPKFGGKGMYGKRVHQAVIEEGEKRSGVTIHFVNAEYDEGKVFLQSSVDVVSSETPESLQEKVKVKERQLIPFVIKKVFESRHPASLGRESDDKTT